MSTTANTPNADSPLCPIRLHGHPLSGHSHRVELFLSLLGLPFEKVTVDLARAEHKGPAFLALNPFGQLPVIEHGDLVLADSNAILVYLALTFDPGAQWLPRDPVGAARVQGWLSVAAGQLAGGPATARVAVVFSRPVDQAPRDVAARLFALMEQHLAAQAFPAAAHPTIADRCAVQLHRTRTRRRREPGAVSATAPVARASRGLAALRRPDAQHRARSHGLKA